MLRKYMHDPSHVLELEPLQINEYLSYDEQPVQILNKKEKVLRVYEGIMEEPFSRRSNLGGRR